MEKHVFKCASCGEVFEPQSPRDARCPRCRSRTLIHLEGPSLKKRGCSSCSTASSCGT